MSGMAENGSKWLEITGAAGNGWTWLERTRNCLKLLDIDGM